MVRQGLLERETRRIIEDHTSGSTALAACAAKLLARAARRGRAQEIARKLLAAHPRMASLHYVVRRALDDGVCADEEVLRFSREAGMRAARLIPEGAAVLTHSASSAVFAALTHAARVRVISTESRPLLEGVSQARRLARRGVHVEVIVDAAAGLFVPRVDLVLTGADAVTGESVVNKAGTALIVRAARDAGVPRYAVCGSDKIVGPGVTLPPERHKPPSEIVRGVRALNYYFDQTPLAWWSGVITEAGLHGATAAPSP
jgi:translation initiation factor 2B subunit (eIF-2B alpha/beta/delta family)